MKGEGRPGILFVMNFPSDTGYAWGTIQKVFRLIADRLRDDGLLSYACFPDAPGHGLTDVLGQPVELVRFDYRTVTSLAGLRQFLRLLRRHRIRILYLTDKATVSWRYPLFRLAGVRTIVVHDRISGHRRSRSAVHQVAKHLLHRIRSLSADLGIGVSRFVVERLVAVNRMPRARTVCVYNGIELARFGGPDGTALADALGLGPESRLVFTSGRAMPYKGIPVLLQAARLLEQAGYEDVHFVYAGDGPALPDFRAAAAHQELRRFHFLGRREDIPALLKSCTVAAVPSVWAEAFGLTVAEAMAAGKPLVATEVGGIPELVDPERTGLLVPPGDPEALARGIRRCLDEPDRARAMGEQAREVAWDRFSIERVANEIAELVRATYRGDSGLPVPRLS